MASCYHCGEKGADYRRSVNTGSSVGIWSSRRSSGTSTRAHYGLRTVCECCAASIDKSNLISTIVFQSIAIIVMLYFLLK